MAQQLYDANSNPRNPEALVDEQAVAQSERQLEALEEEMAILNRVIGMFDSQGWRAVHSMLVQELVRAKQWCARKDQTSNIEDLRFVQGQIAAYEYLIGLGDEATKLKDMRKEQRRQLREELELVGIGS